MMKILIVDDHPIIVTNMERLIKERISGSTCFECHRYQDVIDRYIECQPDFVILDLNIDGNNGLSLIPRMLEHNPRINIIVFSMFDSIEHIKRARKTGVKGYLSKKDPAKNIPLAIHAVSEGKVFFSETIQTALLDYVDQPFNNEHQETIEDKLAPREYEIFCLLGNRYTRKQIADQLGISASTVDTHINRIREKLNLNSNNDVLCLAIQHQYSAIAQLNHDNTIHL
jgi:DNA-binding NarL/FixJ family response regulator